jgi:hypothetical protein
VDGQDEGLSVIFDLCKKPSIMPLRSKEIHINVMIYLSNGQSNQVLKPLDIFEYLTYFKILMALVL